MERLEKDSLLLAVSIVEEMYHTANPVEVCQYLMVEFNIECTTKDLEEAYNEVQPQFCFADLDCEDYRVNYKTCGL